MDLPALVAEYCLDEDTQIHRDYRRRCGDPVPTRCMCCGALVTPPGQHAYQLVISDGAGTYEVAFTCMSWYCRLHMISGVARRDPGDPGRDPGTRRRPPLEIPGSQVEIYGHGSATRGS